MGAARTKGTQLKSRTTARLSAVATALPPHIASRDEVIAGIEDLFPNEDPAFLRGLVERSGVQTRHLIRPAREITRTRLDFTARNALYAEAATALAAEAAGAALKKAGLRPDQIDVIIDVSCTGVVIPAIDVRLAPLLGLRADVRRIPVTESGCAAGTLALGMAERYAQGGARVLVVAVELCTISLVPEDATRTNLVACVLFGDGAGAAVVTPDGSGPTIEAVGSHLFEASAHAMGFDVGAHGLRLVLDRELPAMLRGGLRDVVVEFLTRHGVRPEEIVRHAVHPGGRRILETYAEIFGLPLEALAPSFDTLRDVGNLSSASILHVLAAFEARPAPPAGSPGLVISFGPGLSAEMLLLRHRGLP